MDFRKAQGHWLLAKMGKKVLRPGGKELTLKLIESLEIAPGDHIVEFAPGLGFTGLLALQSNPASYIGVEADKDAVRTLRNTLSGDNTSIIEGTAEDTTLPPESKDKVFAEAMLTMQADHRKIEIIKEAHRILKKGGLYAIHELGLMPDDIDDALKKEITKELAKCIKVNARPLTKQEWSSLIEQQGFRVHAAYTNSMRLLEPGRIIDDEGIWRTLKIGFNLLVHKEARARVLEMRKVFRKYQKQMNAIVIVAEKI